MLGAALVLAALVRDIRLLVTVIVPLMVAVPAIAVAVKTTGPATPAAEALRVFGPAPLPSVQLVTVATPLVFVLRGVIGSMLPPPPVTLNVTGIPATRLSSASVTTTEGATATAVPVAAV